MIIFKCKEITNNLKLNLAYLFLIRVKNNIGNKVKYIKIYYLASAMNYPEFK